MKRKASVGQEPRSNEFFSGVECWESNADTRHDGVMKPGDLVNPRVIFDKKTVGIITGGPTPANGAFGVQNGLLYEVLIEGQISFMFDFELEALNETWRSDQMQDS